MVIVDFRRLFADTKLTKDKIQLVFVGNAAGDLTKVIQTLADINCEEIAG